MRARELVNCGDLMHKGLALLAVFLLVMPLALAQVDGLPSKLVFKGMAEEVTFKVKNESKKPVPVNVKFFVVGFEELKVPKEIDGGRSAELKFRLTPLAGVYGEYNSKVIVRLANEELVVPIAYDFMKLSECPVDFKITKKTDGEKLLLAVDMKSKSPESVAVKLASLDKVPSAWKPKVDKETLNLGPLGGGKMLLELQPVTAFVGLVGLNFTCDKFAKTAEYELKEEGTGKSVGFAPLANVVLGSNATELVVDLFLLVAVALLFIAFVSRLVKRHVSEKEKPLQKPMPGRWAIKGNLNESK